MLFTVEMKRYGMVSYILVEIEQTKRKQRSYNNMELTQLILLTN